MLKGGRRDKQSLAIVLHLTFEDGCSGVVNVSLEHVRIASRYDTVLGTTSIYGTSAVTKLVQALTDVTKIYSGT